MISLDNWTLDRGLKETESTSDLFEMAIPSQAVCGKKFGVSLTVVEDLGKISVVVVSWLGPWQLTGLTSGRG
jgi:hypothetical protein